jgi:hypothetical protein
MSAPRAPHSARSQRGTTNQGGDHIPDPIGPDALPFVAPPLPGFFPKKLATYEHFLIPTVELSSFHRGVPAKTQSVLNACSRGIKLTARSG